ncbi:6329_t:CDS:2 [Dentiscutata heterogama]|uniref:6329_t:CDS:1 n=1 Tax=Dentiscutata heterogama TaxID=1316150 RepID=A0ACA9MFD0_9GLOM|nr:6329_t:CDS:2 [Dentiscutata heterogama]
MPPNLGGFFMVRSYYPSECHADYFDFERIEALKPAIEACGISTLSQSPMLGFHKQMDNRIKLLEEILSFRMQGVEFDNGDMYVDGHKAASDVRDEFVSVTEKLMDELAQCYNVLPQLDINNTIDHRPEGDEKWFLENEKTVTQFCRKLAAERPLKDIRDEYNYPKKKGIKDECSRLLEASTMKSRRGFAIQRLMNAMRQAHADGWFIVFDTLTLADDRLEAFYDNPNALRDYFRDIGRMVLAAEGRKANDSHADCYQYFCVPEYGTANGRLHFHAVHFMRTLPTGSVDPNFGRRDAFSRSGWLWPVDAKGEPLKATSYMAVGFYVAKYVNKKSDMDLAAKAVATSQEAVQNQNEPQLRDENAHNDKSVHGVLNPTYQAGLRRDAVQPDIEAERKKRDEIEAGKSYCSRRFGGATCDDKSAQIYARFDKNDWRIQPAEFYRFHDAEELLLLVYELNRSGLLAENEKIRPILAQLEKLLLCDLSPSTNDSVKN